MLWLAIFSVREWPLSGFIIQATCPEACFLLDCCFCSVEKESQIFLVISTLSPYLYLYLPFHHQFGYSKSVVIEKSDLERFGNRSDCRERVKTSLTSMLLSLPVLLVFSTGDQRLFCSQNPPSRRLFDCDLGDFRQTCKFTSLNQIL